MLSKLIRNGLLQRLDLLAISAAWSPERIASIRQELESDTMNAAQANVLWQAMKYVMEEDES